MNNLVIHPAMKAADVQKLMATIGKKLVARDSNIAQLRGEQETRKLANTKPIQSAPEAV